MSQRHVDYPHQPGWLYDCPACERECFCGNETPPGQNPACCNLAACLPGACHTVCVHCADQPIEPTENCRCVYHPDPGSYQMCSDCRSRWEQKMSVYFPAQ